MEWCFVEVGGKAVVDKPPAEWVEFEGILSANLQLVAAEIAHLDYREVRGVDCIPFFYHVCDDEYI